ncbi:hypothetical protein OM076_04730 [Solirubrobacter ginsenosidimutans]|uniref:Uncharacterized protein n=1 Tax=Solirubrobacter ginsenosidimutans TaxID=490573 RepID=A0A9X3MQY7_9ACTN|nr:hypothetical protein [Solirubrobacter ginsenosidimutans]MDA0159560.1 hypothetical protein [Solirubrobacter ginsenosidimutans]
MRLVDPGVVDAGDDRRGEQPRRLGRVRPGLARYAKNLLPTSVVNRPLEGEPPTIELAVGYSKSNTSPTLKLFLSRLDELTQPNQPH